MDTTLQTLPAAAPHATLALGADLKNAACALDGTHVRWSALHGDLGEAPHCEALEASAHALLASGPLPAALAHDLHPDFHSTRLALALAHAHGLPAVAVQHHHAHLALVAAEHGLVREPVIGWALDGVGLGTDGTAWGGELLWLDAPQRSVRWGRIAHLPALALPGGDRAAREPWRMAAAVLHAEGRGDEIVERLGPRVGATAATTVQRMLDTQLHCPTTTAAGRWFDAAAAALGVHTGAQSEAEAAMALEHAAAQWLLDHPAPPLDRHGSLDLGPLVASLFDVPAERRGAGAARFHLALAHALANAAVAAAHTHDVGTVVLGGGCFFNRILTQHVTARLQAEGLRVRRPLRAGCGDAGLALGQAWVASWTLAHGGVAATEP